MVMKKSFITIVIVFVLAGALLVSASAASFGHLADDLNALGLFRGTNNGYDLESAPNRGQALVMLIRLYGLEEEALACESGHPFADLTSAQDWLSPYVAFAYENGFTTGTSATTFSPNDLCSAQMYVTFVLRALGYSDAPGGDFTYADAIDFGTEAGIVDAMLADGDFLRDQMVAVSYLALLAAPKGDEYGTLLEKLVSEGAVSVDAAAAFTGKLALLNEFLSLGSELAGETGLAMTIKMAANMGILGSMSMDMDMSMIMADEDIQLAMDMNIEMDMMGMGEKMTIPMTMYLVNGLIYMEYDGDKVKMDAGVGDIEDAVISGEAAGQLAIPPYIFTDVKKEVKGDYTVYTVQILDSFFDAIMDAAMGAISGADLGDMGLGGMDLGGMGLGDMDLTVKTPALSFYTDSSGALKKVVIDMDMTMAIDIGGGVKLPINMKISMEMEITAVGDAVQIELPDDLDTYIDYNDLMPAA